jgi:REP element-mobilizing transposase RayT
MNTYSNNKNRKSLRLKNYDYGKNGLYFITICIQNREHLLGDISNNTHTVYDAGLMIETIWHNLPQYYKGIKTKEFVVMPNHIHGIIEFDNSDLDLSELVQRFKTFSTHQYIYGVHNNDWKPFHKKLWQRNYHEHIIRNEKSLEKLQNYIFNNPRQWKEDVLNS